MLNIISPSVQFSAVAQSCPTLRPHESQHTRPPCLSPTPEIQTQVHRVSDAIQPSHPMLSPSPPALSPSQHQGLFQLWHHSVQRNPRADLLQNGLVGSPCSPKDSQESSPTPQFKSINFSVLSLL